MFYCQFVLNREVVEQQRLKLDVWDVGYRSSLARRETIVMRRRRCRDDFVDFDSMVEKGVDTQTPCAEDGLMLLK